MSDSRRATWFAALLCGLAVVSSISPETDAAVSRIMLGILGLGVVAGCVGYVLHIRHIRREIAAGRGMRWRRESAPPPGPVPPRSARGPSAIDDGRADAAPATSATGDCHSPPPQ